MEWDIWLKWFTDYYFFPERKGGRQELGGRPAAFQRRSPWKALSPQVSQGQLGGLGQTHPPESLRAFRDGLRGAEGAFPSLHRYSRLSGAMGRCALGALVLHRGTVELRGIRRRCLPARPFRNAVRISLLNSEDSGGRIGHGAPGLPQPLLCRRRRFKAPAAGLGWLRGPKRLGSKAMSNSLDFHSEARRGLLSGKPGKKDLGKRLA